MKSQQRSVLLADVFFLQITTFKNFYAGRNGNEILEFNGAFNLKFLQKKRSPVKRIPCQLQDNIILRLPLKFQVPEIKTDISRKDEND